MDYNDAHDFFYNRIDNNNSIKMLTILADDKTSEGLKLIKELTSCDDNTAKLLWVDLKCDFGTTENNAILQAREQRKKETLIQNYEYRNNVECPYCHSKNTKKITTTAKAINTAVFGIFGTKRHKQWHCDNCKSDF